MNMSTYYTDIYLITESSAWCIHNDGCFTILKDFNDKEVYELWYTEDNPSEIPEGYCHTVASSSNKEDLTALMVYIINEISLTLKDDALWGYINLNETGYNDRDIFPNLKLH